MPCFLSDLLSPKPKTNNHANICSHHFWTALGNILLVTPWFCGWIVMLALSHFNSGSCVYFSSKKRHLPILNPDPDEASRVSWPGTSYRAFPRHMHGLSPAARWPAPTLSKCFLTFGTSQSSQNVSWWTQALQLMSFTPPGNWSSGPQISQQKAAKPPLNKGRGKKRKPSKLQQEKCLCSWLPSAEVIRRGSAVLGAL